MKYMVFTIQYISQYIISCYFNREQKTTMTTTISSRLHSQCGVDRALKSQSLSLIMFIMIMLIKGE